MTTETVEYQLDVLNTMREHATHIATNFAEWVSENEYSMLVGTKAWESPHDKTQYSTRDLFNKYTFNH